MEPHQLINQTSGITEYYTPLEIVEAARNVMGGIDLDPASSEYGNLRVNATNYYDEYDDGLSQPWNGRVWMNHPFGRKENPKWIQKLVGEWASGRVTEACCITYACTSEKWFRPLLLRIQCYLQPRTNYLLPDGSIKRGVTKGSVVTYFGNKDSNEAKFYSIFKELGVVKL